LRVSGAEEQKRLIAGWLKEHLVSMGWTAQDNIYRIHRRSPRCTVTVSAINANLFADNARGILTINGFFSGISQREEILSEFDWILARYEGFQKRLVKDFGTFGRNGYLSIYANVNVKATEDGKMTGSFFLNQKSDVLLSELASAWISTRTIPRGSSRW